ncbi:MAG TPA: iduronate-2-sulfatase [Bacteroidales bacterium]|nr:iduronate-2-sulfatase [Bacteroidales bacterium]
MKIISCIIIILFLLVISCKESPDKPDILFIAIDDMNDWITPLGGRENMHTPNIDALAGRGMLFENAHCTAPACCPSRTSVMTGVRPSTSGIYANTQIWRHSTVLEKALTIPEFFREQGYTVRGGGKIFHALSWIQTAYGIDQNDFTVWDEYYPSMSRSIPPSIWPESYEIDSLGTVYWENIAGRETEGRPSYFFDWGPLGKEEDMADNKVVDWAISKLKEKYDKPLFLAVGIYRPHIPWFVPEEYFDLYPVEERDLPAILENDLDDVSPASYRWVRRNWQKWMIENEQWKYAVQAYEASISFSDAMLGKLIRGLDESGRADNTIIVLWSDHGMHIGEKEQWEKFTLWEESTRVPLIIIVPGLTKAGSRSVEAVSLLDIYPTLVRLAGKKKFDQLEGTDLLPLIKDPDSKRDEPAITTFHKDNHSVRTERWRYIRYFNGDEELYDHKNDPDEYYNLADSVDLKPIIEELSKWLPEINVNEL